MTNLLYITKNKNVSKTLCCIFVCILNIKRGYNSSSVQVTFLYLFSSIT